MPASATFAVRMAAGRAAAVLLGMVMACAVAAGTPARAAERDQGLFIITSFPEAVFSRFEAAFEAAHPGVSVKILNRKTSAAIAYIQSDVVQRPDVFWASAPDAFEVLKNSGDLAHYSYAAPGVPESVDHYPINDPDGYYTGFAISGYGMMWNERYLERHGLPVPRKWSDLADPVYAGHLGITAPSRSGTTHVIVESILQAYGWEKGWALLMETAGNLATVSARSFSVVEGVGAGRFGIGLVIDFLGLSAKASGLPVDFGYAETTPLIPANVAVLRGTRHRELAEAFVRFLLSKAGQKILFEPEIHRLPVVPAIYGEAPPGYPDPFAGGISADGTVFDSQLSRSRYHMVNSLFDAMITFRVRDLNQAWAAIHRAEAVSRKSPNPDAVAAIAKARRLASQVPVSAGQAIDDSFTSIFVRKQRGRSLPPRQAELEAAWKDKVADNLRDATRIAEAQARALESRTAAEKGF